MKAYERCCASSNKFLQHTVVNGWWPISTWDKRVFFAGRMPQSSIAAYCSTSFQLCLFIDATGYRASFSLWWLVCKDLKMTHHSEKFFQGFHFGIQADNLPGWATRIALQLSQSPAGRYRSSQSLVHMQFKLATWYDLQMMARNTHLSCGCCLMLLDVYRH